MEIESFREQAPIRKDSNVVWDLGVHDISILRYLLNSNPIKIKSIKYNTVKTKQKDTAYINLNYKDNLKVFIKCLLIQSFLNLYLLVSCFHA